MTTITIDRNLLEQVLDVLITRGAQPGYETERAWLKIVKSLEAALSAPATAPERKPMPILEVNARWEQSVLGITRLQYYQVVREVEAFHGIKP